MHTMKSTESLIPKAVRAPSSHNTQPWLFHVLESRISLYAGRSRALPVNDPDDRELTISCGGALMNRRVAGAAEGLDVSIEVVPDPDEPDLLARLSFSATPPAPREEASRVSFIERRRTYRKRFVPREVKAAALNLLRRAFRRFGCAWVIQPRRYRRHPDARLKT